MLCGCERPLGLQTFDWLARGALSSTHCFHIMEFDKQFNQQSLRSLSSDLGFIHIDLSVLEI